MADAVLIFTFSPVQPFIMEARRVADLFTGSRILVELARAAATGVKQSGGTLIFPAALGGDVPNKLVATVPAEKVQAIANTAHDALLKKWDGIAQSARDTLRRYDAEQDKTWKAIWSRQINNLWEVHWAAAPMTGGPETYAAAYRQADAALHAAKRTRVFEAADEQGLKDSLSGRREALHTANTDAKGYWTRVSNAKGMTAAQLRPEGRERLDAVGAIKRFSAIAQNQRFFSTSTVASEDFRRQANGLLSPYRTAIETLIPGEKLYRVRSDPEWPYDGDLFYPETLTPDRLRDSYGVHHLDQRRLDEAKRELQELHKKVGRRPSPYYAVIVLDGDSMGKRVSDCLAIEEPQEQHRKLSEQLSQFAKQVNGIVQQHASSLIYNGGDDVLLLAPLSRALLVAQELARHFQAVTGGTASAGIAIAHHLYPLDAALRAAREAEAAAKSRYGRNALCVRALKRSGETLQVGSKWTDGNGNHLIAIFNAMVEHFQQDRLGSRFAYDVVNSAYALPEADERLRAELKRLLTRHCDRNSPDALDPAKWAERLYQWARMLPEGEQAEGLGRWLVLARFLAQGGGE